MPGDELEAHDVASMLQHLYSVSSMERLFCPFCDVRLNSRVTLNLNLAVCARMPTSTEILGTIDIPLQEAFHRSGKVVLFDHDFGEDHSEEEGERYLAHLSCYHG